MAGRILIVETGGARSAELGHLLDRAGYHIEIAGNATAALNRIEEEMPDLVLLRMVAGQVAGPEFCVILRMRPECQSLPVVALIEGPDSIVRLAALRAGADDVIDMSGDEGFLLARLRSLLRRREAAADLGLGESDTRVLGLAEAGMAFAPAGQCAVLTPRAADLPPAVAALIKRMPGARIIPETEAQGHSQRGQGDVDLFLIDHAAEARRSDRAGLCRLIADLRAQRATRHAKLIVMLETTSGELAELALDLGADELVPAAIEAEELAFRVRGLLRSKTKADQQRNQLQSSLQDAIRDPLTGIYNRRYAMAVLSSLFARKAETGEIFSISILDIDHFKRINDSFGHTAGDQALRQVSALLSANLRVIDTVARIGGEEFLVIMPGTSIESAELAMQRIRALVAGARIDLSGRGSGPMTTLTLSAGIAAGEAVEERDDPVGSLFELADRALYRAKALGRNTVTVATSAA